MSAIEAGQKAPDFSQRATDDLTIQLSSYENKKNVVLYFYPRDSTPGCTLEGQDFTRLHGAFEAKDTVILGVSRDSMRRHQNFKTKHGFPFPLISDEDESVCTLYDVLKEKKNYGKTYIGIVRSTFLMDKEGVVRKVWSKVRVKGHAEEVLAAVEALEG